MRSHCVRRWQADIHTRMDVDRGRGTVVTTSVWCHLIDPHTHSWGYTQLQHEVIILSWIIAFCLSKQNTLSISSVNPLFRFVLAWENHVNQGCRWELVASFKERVDFIVSHLVHISFHWKCSIQPTAESPLTRLAFTCVELNNPSRLHSYRDEGTVTSLHTG